MPVPNVTAVAEEGGCEAGNGRRWRHRRRIERWFARWMEIWNAWLGIGGIIVEKVVVGGEHFAVARSVVIVTEALTFVGAGGADRFRAGTGLGAFLEIKDGKRANVTEAIDVDGKLADKVDESIAALGEAEDEHEWRGEDAEDLLDKDHHFEFVELRKFLLDLVAVKATSPFGRQVVSVVDHVVQSVLWIEDQIFLRYSASKHRPNGTKDSKIENDRSIGSDFKVEEDLGVDDRCQSQNPSQCPGQECQKTCHLYRFILGKLIDVARSKRI